jgi:replicative DNA helicase
MKKQPEEILSHYTFGKLPPQAVELEEAVLGACLIETQAVIKVIDIVTPESFYFPQNQLIFKAITNLYERNRKIDILTVSENLKGSGHLEDVGGMFYISQLTNKIGSTANIEEHAQIVQQKFIQRELIRISSNCIQESYTDQEDVFSLVDYVQAQLIELSKSGVKQQIQHLSSIVTESRKQINRLSASPDAIIGISTGIKCLDKVISGLEDETVITLAARPGMGKSALAVSIIKNVGIEQKIPCALFSIEMPSIQQEQRLKANVSDIPYSRLRSGKLHQEDWEKLDRAEKLMNESPIYFDDSSSLSAIELRSKITILVSEHDIKFIVIDYLQLMSGSGKKGQNREQEISEISRTVKRISKELGIPILQLAQLSRSVEQRGGNKTPLLSDLRESGSIEQDSDIVIFIHRPEYYGITESENGLSTKGMADLIIAKNRNGSIETIATKFEGEFMRFSDIETYQPISLNLTNYSEPTKNNFPKGKESDFDEF